MAQLYTISIQGASGDFVFVRAPALDIVTIDRRHRRGVEPFVLLSAVLEYRFSGCILTDDGAGNIATQLGDFLTGFAVLKSVQPTYIRIARPAGTPIPVIGSVGPGGSGEQLELLSWNLPNEPQQLDAEGKFDLSFRVVMNIDSTFLRLEQTQKNSAGPTGLPRQQLTTFCEVSKASGINLEAAAVVALAALAKPAGWRRIGDSNNTLGVAISFDGRWPLKTIGTLVSEIEQLGGGIVLPDLAGDGTRTVETTNIPDAGIKVTRTGAEITGSVNPLAFVESIEPDGSVGTIRQDLARRVAVGSWTNQEALVSLKEKTVRVRAVRQLSFGGKAISELPFGGGLLSKLRPGAIRRWQLVERVEARGLGVEELSQLALPPRLPPPWVFDPGRSFHELPQAELAGQRSEDSWTRVMTRAYFWDGEGEPLDDAAFQKIAMLQWRTAGEGDDVAQGLGAPDSADAAVAEDAAVTG